MNHSTTRHFRFIPFALLLLVAWSCLSLRPVQAQQQRLIDGSNPQDILEIAKGHGSAVWETSGNSNPVIRGRMNGTLYFVLFSGCNNGKNCKEIGLITFFAGEKISLRNVNKWNKENLYGKLYFGEDGVLNLKMAVNLNYGVSWKNLDDTFVWWRIVLNDLTSSPC